MTIQTLSGAEKAQLLAFIKWCRLKGLEPQKEATKRFLEVRDRLEVNTPAYRLAHFKPTAFYVPNTADEAVFELINEVNA